MDTGNKEVLSVKSEAFALNCSSCTTCAVMCLSNKIFNEKIVFHLIYIHNVPMRAISEAFTYDLLSMYKPFNHV